ncbi:MAG: hypothetical protein ABR972_12195 [Acidimicrobiales bacterium]
MAGRLLDHDPDVAAWTGYKFADAQIDGLTVPVLVGKVNRPSSSYGSETASRPLRAWRHWSG